MVTDYSDDDLNSVTGITVAKNGTDVIWSSTYRNNVIGKRTSTKVLGGKGDMYQYDAIGQVTGVKCLAGNADSGYN